MTDKETAVRFWNRLIDWGIYANLGVTAGHAGESVSNPLQHQCGPHRRADRSSHLGHGCMGRELRIFEQRPEKAPVRTT